ncbi:XPA protein C-terminus-domain-containing protein, partial [Kalaharituber pfeilii]
LTPEQIRRIETNRLKAKALYEEHQKNLQIQQINITTAGVKRTHGEITSSASSSTPVTTRASRYDVRNSRDGRIHSNTTPSTSGAVGAAGGPPPLRPSSRKLASYVEYDFSKMTDTKGGFLSTVDDPLSIMAIDTTGKPDDMSIEAWADHLRRKKMRESKQGAFEPHLSALNRGTDKEKLQEKCYECGSWEIDWQFLEVFRCRVCHKCKEKMPEKYSLLTKTECKEDYLITDPELKDTTILPHLSKPNPHKSTWNDMQLFLRYQVEERAIAKWGSFEKLDEEFEKRQGEKKRKRDEKFRLKLKELKNRTRVETWKRSGGSNGEKKGKKHEHIWGVPVQGEGGMEVRRCEECGFEVEEL